MEPELKKPILPPESWQELLEIAQMTNAMPEGPQKEKAKRVLGKMHGALVEQYELPLEKTLDPSLAAKLKVGMDILDYPSGVVRAGVGEPLVLAKQAVSGEPVNLKQAKENIVRAVLPSGEPAPDIKNYRERLGFGGEGPSLADIPGVDQVIPKGGVLDITAGGAADLAGAIATDPAVLKQGVKGAVKLLKSPGESAKTAVQLREELAAALEKSGGMEKVKNFLAGAGEVIADPREALGKLAYRMRFADADKATKAAGKKRFSDTYLENVKPSFTRGGLTSEGVYDDVNQLVRDKEALISEVHAPNQVNMAVPAPRQEDVLSPLAADDVLMGSVTPGQSQAYRDAAKEIRDEFADVADYWPMGYPPEILRRTARAFQQKAAEAGRYGRAAITVVKPKEQVKQLGDVKIYGDLAHQVGMRARDLEADSLDIINKGAGGQVWRNYRDMSSVLEGAPFIDRAFRGKGANAGSRFANSIGGLSSGNLFTRIPTELAIGSKNVLLTGAGKASLSPVSLYALQPALRLQVQEKLNEMNEQNPYTQLRRAGVEIK